MTRVEKLEKAATELRHELFHLEETLMFLKGTDMEKFLEGLEGQPLELALPDLQSAADRVRGLNTGLGGVKA